MQRNYETVCLLVKGGNVDTFSKVTMVALGIFMVVMAIGSIFSIEFITNAPLVDLSREQLNEFRTRTVRPSLFLTCAYFIFRYFRGKNPTTTIWPVYVVFASYSFVQIIAMFTMPVISFLMIIGLSLSLFITAMLRIAHNKRQKQVNTF